MYEEPYQFALRIAKKEVEVASHLSHLTINDKNVILSATEHLTKSAKLALQALLDYERKYKRIDNYATSMAAQIDIFQLQVMERKNFDKSTPLFLRRLNKLKEGSKNSFVAYDGVDRYFLLGEDRDSLLTNSVSADDLKVYLQSTKTFIAKVEEITKDG